jgi:hypothetical protein
MSTLKKLVFGKGLMLPSFLGEKKITIRRYRKDAHDFKKGDHVQAEFMDGLNAIIEITADTVVKPFSKLTREEAMEDGFRGVKEAFLGVAKHYPDLKRRDLMAVIRYRMPELEKVPYVSTNAYTVFPDS